MRLNCVGPLICGHFSIVNTTALHDPWSVDSMDAERAGTEEPRIWRTRARTVTYIWIFDYPEDQYP